MYVAPPPLRTVPVAMFSARPHRDAAAHKAFTLPYGKLRRMDNAALDRLEAFLVTNPPASTAILESIENSFLDAHEPLPAATRALFDDSVRFRRINAQLTDTNVLRYFPALLRTYGLPPLRYMSLLRNVTLLYPTPALAATRRAFTGVLFDATYGSPIPLVSSKFFLQRT